MSAGLSPTASAIVRFVGWSFLPAALARTLMTSYHRFMHPGSPPPAPGTPTFVSRYRIAYTALAVSYLAYTLIAAATSLEPNYYELLGCERDADEQGLKLAFRAFARRNHPDRPGIGPSGEQRFREVRNAFEMLKSPVKRFAYERFGPDVINWKECNTPREYIKRGLMSSGGFFVGSGGILVTMSLLGKSNSSSFWRYLLLLAVLFAELYLILSPSPMVVDTDAEAIPTPIITHTLPIISTLLPSRLPFQQIQFMHQLFVSLGVCMSHLAPILFPDVGLAAMSEKEAVIALGDVMKRLSAIGGIAEREVSRMLHQELRSLHGASPPSPSQSADQDDPVMDALAKEMQNLLIESRLRSHPVLRSIWDRIISDNHTAVDMNPSSTPRVVVQPDTSATKLFVPKISIPIDDALPSPSLTLASLNSPISDTTATRRRSPSQEAAYLSDHSTQSSASTLLGRRSHSPSTSMDEKSPEGLANGRYASKSTDIAKLSPLVVLSDDRVAPVLGRKHPSHGD